MKTIGVIGTGTMGSGIIQTLAVNGYDVLINDIKQEFIDGGIARITKNLEKLVKKEKMTEDDKKAALGRIKGSVEVSIMKDAELVIEAATENPELKKGIFKNLDGICPPETILASNTSSLSITEIAGVTKRPTQVIGMHFFNPAPVMKLVEVIRGYNTCDNTNAAILELAKSLGKTPVQVNESAGFVVNRILVPEINEGAFILQEGIATKEDIDTAMKLGANHPMGPLALGDLVGLDVVVAVMDVLYSEFQDPKFRCCPLLRKMVRGGKLGMKSGEGFYKYDR